MGNTEEFTPEVRPDNANLYPRCILEAEAGGSQVQGQPGQTLFQK